MTLVLHSHPLSSYCWKVLIALYESGASDRILMSGDHGQEVLGEILIAVFVEHVGGQAGGLAARPAADACHIPWRHRWQIAKRSRHCWAIIPTRSR